MKVSLKRRLARIEPRHDPEQKIRAFYLQLCRGLPGEKRDRLRAMVEKYKDYPVIMRSDMDAADRKLMKDLLAAADPQFATTD